MGSTDGRFQSRHTQFMHKRQQWLILSGLIIGLVLVLAVAGWQNYGRSPEKTTQALSLPPPPAIDPASIDQLLPQDSIPAIDQPQFEPAQQVTDIAPQERVIGLEINGDARAYPINILSSHEIVNDVVGGEPVAITWCPLCYSALVFSRRVNAEEKVLSFGVSGKLLYNTLVMYDRETGSLWSQLYGGAVAGSLVGAPLAVYPSVFTQWEVWLAQHPDSRVLSKRLSCDQFDCGTYASNPRGSYAVDPYASYYASADEGIINRQIPREEGVGASKERVLGVRVAGLARAYPYDVLQKQPVINDFIGDTPVLIWFDRQSQTGAAYRRVVDGQDLTFVMDENNPGFLRDDLSNTLWQGNSGLAVDGRFQNAQLAPLISTSAFSFGWNNYFSESER